jgi:hypothetical protein
MDTEKLVKLFTTGLADKSVITGLLTLYHRNNGNVLDFFISVANILNIKLAIFVDFGTMKKTQQIFKLSHPMVTEDGHQFYDVLVSQSLKRPKARDSPETMVFPLNSFGAYNFELFADRNHRVPHKKMMECLGYNVIYPGDFKTRLESLTLET